VAFIGSASSTHTFCFSIVPPAAHRTSSLGPIVIGWPLRPTAGPVSLVASPFALIEASELYAAPISMFGVGR
jgi:hypothetical protein